MPKSLRFWIGALRVPPEANRSRLERFVVILWRNELGHPHRVYGRDCVSHAGGDVLARLVQAAEGWRKLLLSLTAMLQIHVPTWALLVSLIGFVRRCLRSRGPQLALLCGFLALDAYAAKPSIQTDPTYLIDTWETEDGLPENSATAMVQTPDGYLWFGTFNGLVRFDGMKFTVFRPNDTPELPAAEIVNLHVDQRGWLWVSTLRGTAVLADNKWRSFGTSEGWAGNHVRTFAERRNGDLLITTFDGKVLEFANGRLGQLPEPPGEADKGYQGLADGLGQWWVVQHRFFGHWDGQRWMQTAVGTQADSDKVSCAAARDGGMWLLLNKELRKYRSGTEVSRLELPLPERLRGVWSVFEDSRRNVWICTPQQGLLQVSPAGTVRHWTTTNGLSSNSTRFVFEDRETNLWVGTSGGGLQRFKPKRFHTFGAEVRTSRSVVSSIAASAAGDVWIATFGQGLFRRRGSELTKVPLPRDNEVTRYLQSVLEDRLGRAWVGTYYRGLWLLDGQDPRVISSGETGGEDVTTLFEDSRGRVWIAGGLAASLYDGGKIRVFGPQEGLPPGPISCFAEDSSGVVWLAHRDGVFRFEKDHFTLINDASGLQLLDITCLRADPRGSMWMGSLTRGLIRWREGKLVTVGAAAGLPVHTIYSILEDKHGTWWMTSDAGVLRASLADLQAAADNPVARVRCQIFDVNDGLLGTNFSTGRQPLSACDTEGKLWFATSKGTAMIDPEQLSVNEVPPPTHIEKISYFVPGYGASNGRQVELRPPFPEKVFLPPGSRRLEISYTGLSYVSAEKVRFQLKLEHEDAEWLEAGNRRVAYYYDLNPRDYVFRMRAANNDGVWNEAGASLAFTVQPLFWQTLWFKALGLVVLAALAYGGIHRRVTQLEKERAAQQAFARQVILSEENERKRIAGELHDGLGQNLLLIKNRLTLAVARQSDAAEHTRQLEAATAATTRAIGEVRAISHALRPAALEQVGLTKAIESMVEELGEGSATNFAAELDEIDGLLAPEMEMNLFRIIQEGLNNITRHAGARQVILEAKREEPGLRVSLFDDGRGFDADKVRDGTGARHGLGLASMNERVKYLGGRLDLQSKPGRGTRVTVRVPLGQTRV